MKSRGGEGSGESLSPGVLRDPVQVLPHVGVDARLAWLSAPHAEGHDADVAPSAVAHLQQEGAPGVSLLNDKRPESRDKINLRVVSEMLVHSTQ